MWKKILFILFFCTISHVSAKDIRIIPCYVVSISDGDTLNCLLSNNKKVKVRLQEIDAPEKKQAFGKKARQYLAQLVYKKRVNLYVSGYDRYQRMLATVYNLQGQNINLAMVNSGFAWAYQQYLKDPTYLKAQQYAQSQKLGLWRDPNPTAPHIWRQQRKNRNKAYEF